VVKESPENIVSLANDQRERPWRIRGHGFLGVAGSTFSIMQFLGWALEQLTILNSIACEAEGKSDGAQVLYIVEVVTSVILLQSAGCPWYLD
jgi:hypothetical protein